MENINTFDNISQRVLFAYKVAFSDFQPVESGEISVASQKQLHILMRELQNKLYSAPELLDLPTDEDRAFPSWACNNQLPELNKIY